MLDSYKASLKHKQTNEEQYRAYPNPKIEKKYLEIFQKMTQGTQTLLDKKLDKQRSFEDYMESPWERGQVPCAPWNLISSNGANIEGPNKSKKKKRIMSTESKMTMPPALEVLESSPDPQVEPHVESLVEHVEMVPSSVSKDVGDKWMKDLWDEI